MVIGPLFLAIGMEPQVGTSSCAFMILWTAFSGVVIYGVDEHLGYVPRGFEPQSSRRCALRQTSRAASNPRLFVVTRC